MNWVRAPTKPHIAMGSMDLSLEDYLYQAIVCQDLEAVTTLLAQGANPNKTTCHGKTCLGAASHLGNVEILKPLLERCSEILATVPIAPLVGRRSHRSHKRRLAREDTADESSSRCKVRPLQEPNSSSECFAYSGTETSSCPNRGYFVFIHEDELTAEASSDASPVASTPSPLAELEWDEEVGTVAPSTREDETWSSLYKWYAAILECTGAALACAAAMPSGIDQQDSFLRTAAHYAAEQGRVQALQMLLDAGCKVDASAGDGLTPLHAAVSRDRRAAVRLLLDRGAHVNYATNEKTTALHMAASRGYVELVEMLVAAGAALESRDTSERTALFVAAGRGHDDVLRCLIAAGANVNGEEIHGYTPLCEAVWQRNVSSVKLLLSAGARVTHSHRLLHNAVLQQQEEIVTLLAAAGGINIHDDNGDTPLLLAARTSQPRIARILLKYGANVNCSDSITGATAVHVAVERIDSVAELEALLVELLEHGVDVDAASLTGDTALNRAILLHRDDAVVLLVRHGADVNTCHLQACALDNLALVARRRPPGLARLLVKAGHELPAPAAAPPTSAPDTAAGYLYHASRNPLLLADLCRLKIRSLHGRTPLTHYVSALRLPKRLTSFLMLEDEGS